MNLPLTDPHTWELIAERITTERDYHYYSSDRSHMTDMAQIVCQALNELNREVAR